MWLVKKYLGIGTENEVTQTAGRQHRDDEVKRTNFFETDRQSDNRHIYHTYPWIRGADA